MPNQKNQDQLQLIKDRLAKSKSTVVVDYSGTNVENHTELRQALKDVGGEMLVTKNTLIDLYSEIEGAAITNLEDSRNQAEGNRSLSTWVGAAEYIMKTANADAENYYNYMKTDLQNDKYFGLLQEIHTGNMNALIAEQTAQGAQNDTNLQFQYPGFEFYTSTSITNGSDLFGLVAYEIR